MYSALLTTGGWVGGWLNEQARDGVMPELFLAVSFSDEETCLPKGCFGSMLVPGGDFSTAGSNRFLG